MRRSVLATAVLAMACSAAVLAIATISELTLNDGRTDANTLATPVLDPAKAPTLQFAPVTATFDRGAKIVRKGASGFFTKGPEYNLGSNVDLAALLGEALRREAAAMGFGGSGSPVWKVETTIKDIYIESKQVPYGATLFWGYMDLEVTTSSPDREQARHRFAVHNYAPGFNAGIGRKDEAQVALARLLLQGSQDVLARLNRKVFHAPPNDRIDTLVKAAAPGEADLHAIGLAAPESANDALVRQLASEQDEDRRAWLIDALALIGSPASVTPLADRFAREKDEDCRWYTIKALDYIDTAEAREAIKTKGLTDPDSAVSRLSIRSLGLASK